MIKLILKLFKALKWFHKETYFKLYFKLICYLFDHEWKNNLSFYSNRKFLIASRRCQRCNKEELLKKV